MMEQKHIEVVVNNPPSDDISWLWTGVLVPIALALFAWWRQRQ